MPTSLDLLVQQGNNKVTLNTPVHAYGGVAYEYSQT